jgi:hypothetical protein
MHTISVWIGIGIHFQMSMYLELIGSNFKVNQGHHPDVLSINFLFRNYLEIVNHHSSAPAILVVAGY